MKKIILLGIVSTFFDCYAANLNSQFMLRLADLEDNNRVLTGETEALKNRLAILESKIIILEKQLIENYNKQQEKNTSQASGSTCSVNTDVSSKDIINKCEELIKQNRLKEVIGILTDFLAEHKDDIYRGQAFFLLGLAYEKNGQKQKAVVAYLSSVSARKNGSKAPLAMLNAARILSTTARKEHARCILKKLLSEYKNKKDICLQGEQLLAKLSKKTRD